MTLTLFLFIIVTASIYVNVLIFHSVEMYKNYTFEKSLAFRKFTDYLVCGPFNLAGILFWTSLYYTGLLAIIGFMSYLVWGLCDAGAHMIRTLPL